MKLITMAHIVATLFMAGLTWFVQVVRHLLVANFGQAQFKMYEERHQRFKTSDSRF
ncbi:MAG: hypothetical protein WAO83_12500 [Fuerstiella sp.]